MKTNRVKTLLIVAMAAVLLTAAIGGTIAWIATSDGPVINTFTPGEVDTETKEEFDNGNKTSVIIQNFGTVPVYVRVAIYGNYVDDAGEIVAGWTPNFNYNTTTWIKIGDYYYYKTAVAPEGEAGSETSNLLSSAIAQDTREDGSHLEVTVLHQSIQSEGTTTVNNVEVPVVQAVWGVTVSNGSITGPVSAQ